jgi:hypothetical protein
VMHAQITTTITWETDQNLTSITFTFLLRTRLGLVASLRCYKTHPWKNAAKQETNNSNSSTRATWRRAHLFFWSCCGNLPIRPSFEGSLQDLFRACEAHCAGHVDFAKQVDEGDTLESAGSFDGLRINSTGQSPGPRCIGGLDQAANASLVD